MKKKMIRRYIAAAACLLLTGLSMLLFKNFPGLFFPGYRRFSKAVMTGLAAVTGLFPFALWDIGEICLIGLLIFSIVRMIVKKKSFFNWLSHVLLIVSLMLLEVVGCWMLNHYAPPLSVEIGLEKKKSSEAELYDAAAYYLEKAISLSDSVPRDDSGSLIRQDIREMAKIAGKSYRKLEADYPVFKGSGAPVKYLTVFNDYLLYRGNSGEFMPLTGEATVPEYDAVADLPFAMCHEAAHRLGIAGEDEANFAAFLACTSNDDPRFVYAGYYMAYVYCSNRLSKAGRQKLHEEFADSGQRVFLDGREQAAHYDRFDSPLQAVEDKVNDSYLKTFSEESGVKSYGEVADDLIAWYRKTAGE